MVNRYCLGSALPPPGLAGAGVPRYPAGHPESSPAARSNGISDIHNLGTNEILFGVWGVPAPLFTA